MLTGHEHDPHACGPVVIADDNDNDVFLLRRKLNQIGVTAPLVVLRDGHETIEFLKQVCHAHAPDRLPAILFLDLKMPRATGFSVLCWLREQEALESMKVVILSDSEDPGDVALATALDADAYLAKQPGADELGALLQRFAPSVLSPAMEVTTAR